MHVLDIRDEDEYKLWESAVELPFNSVPMLLTTTQGQSESRLLCSGWIRRTFGEFASPMVISRLIASYCCIENVHVLRSSDSEYVKTDNGVSRHEHDKIYHQMVKDTKSVIKKLQMTSLRGHKMCLLIHGIPRCILRVNICDFLIGAVDERPLQIRRQIIRLTDILTPKQQIELMDCEPDSANDLYF